MDCINPDRPHPCLRREFLGLLGLGGGVGLAVPAAVATQDPPPAEVDPATAEAEARMALVIARFGTHLDDAAREDVRKQVDGVVSQGRRLREVGLENSDAPFPLFRPYRAPLA